ncbi:MAG: DUF4347 domain-containing protein, partial [Magnetococcales bacterium]|nr:DUF4347 domain-containing protein [Magnetococcales bacterium]
MQWFRRNAVLRICRKFLARGRVDNPRRTLLTGGPLANPTGPVDFWALEPRLIFDGAGLLGALHLPDGVDPATDPAASAHPAETTPPPAKPVVPTAPAPTEPVSLGPVSTDPASERHEILFIDSRVPDREILLQGVKPGVQVVILTPNQDGVQQIAQVLAQDMAAPGATPFDAIHIVSHGEEGEVFLGSAVLSNATLSRYTQALQQWGQALTTTGDLLLYGCDIAEGSDGQAFIDQIAQRTGADVAASNDWTGAAQKGGDWTLEVDSGPVETAVAFRATTQRDYADILAPPTILAVSIPDAPMKVGSVVTSTITVASDTNDYTTGLGGITGTIDGFTLGALHKVNDTQYTATFTVTEGGTDVPAGTDIPLSITLADPSGTASNTFATAISQANDSIDAHSPTLAITSNVTAVKVGETATITFTFSEDPGATFTNGDIVVSNGTLGAITGAGLTRTATFTPTAGIQAINASITVAAGTYTDPAGNPGGAGTTPTISIDTLAPTTTINGIHISADTGTSATDFLTNTAAQTITGTLSTGLVAGEILYGSVDGGTTWANITAKAAGTAISWDGATLAGSSSIAFKVTDTAGNDGSIASQAYVLDATNPTTTISGISLSADTGTSATDFLTNTAAQTITGTLSAVLAGSEILYGSVDGGTTWTNITNKVAGTALSWNGTTLAGSSAIEFKVTNAAGTDGTTTIQTYVLDTTLPVITIGGLSLSADTGTSAADFITNTAAQTITGTLSGVLMAGDPLYGSDILYGSVNGGTTWIDITNQVTGTAITWNGAFLAGISAIEFKVTDAAGNDGPVATHAYTLDTSNTTTISSIHILVDDGTSNSDFITSVAAQTITGTLSVPLLTADPQYGSDVLWGSVDNGTTWTNITNKAAGTALSWTGATLSGSSAIVIKMIDAAGNNGAPTIQAYTVGVPTTTTISGIHISTDTGTSATDFVTKIAAQTITGTLSATLTGGDILYGSVDGGTSWTDITNKVTGTAISWNGTTLLAGGNAIEFKVSNAGLDGASTTQNYVLDTTNTTTITGILLSADTAANGATNADFNTKTAAQTITGTLSTALMPGDILYGSIDGGTTWIDITNKAAATAISWNGAALAGSSAIQIKMTDLAGNDSAVTNQAYILDQVAPTTAIASMALSADTAANNATNSDFITKTTAQTISGTLNANLVAGETVYVSLNNGATWAAATATVGTSTWSLAGQTLVASNTLEVKVTDIAGNDGPVASQAYVLDTTA